VKKNNAKTLICDEISIKIPKISNFVITELKTDGKNPNKMTEKQKTALKKNIKEFGFIVPIITNEDLVIADGEHRWICAKELGMREVPVVRLPVSDVDRRILRQVLNKLKGSHDKKLDFEEYSLILNESENLNKLNELDYYLFLVNCFKNLKEFSKEKAPCFMWSGDRFLHTLINAGNEVNYKVNQLCVWIKNHFQWSPSTIFHKASEYCVVFFKNGNRPNFINKYYVCDKDNIFKIDFNNFINLFDVWYEPRDNISNYVHPTQKPLRLAERALFACSMPMDIVLDLFGGSGSTLIACEKMDRVAYLMELDPKYCDVIIKRWETLTGKKAVKVS
jgi:DNA modification methylase